MDGFVALLYLSVTYVLSTLTANRPRVEVEYEDADEEREQRQLVKASTAGMDFNF